MSDWFLSDWTLWVITALVGLVGLFLFFRGLVGEGSHGRPRCRKCGYDMSASESLTCPECGRAYKSRKRLFQTRRFWKRAIFGAMLFLAALYCHSGPDVQYRRNNLGESWARSLVPTTALIILAPSLDENNLGILAARLSDLNERYERHDDVWLRGSLVIVGDASESDGVPEFGLQYDRQRGLTDLQATLLLKSASQVLRDRGRTDEERYRALIWIRQTCMQANDPQPVLHEVLKDVKVDATARASVIDCLMHVGPVDNRLISILTERLEDEDVLVCAHAATALAHIGESTADIALNPLVQLLMNTQTTPGAEYLAVHFAPNTELRRVAAWSLCRLGSTGLEALGCTLLDDTIDDEFKEYVIDLLDDQRVKAVAGWSDLLEYGVKEYLNDISRGLDVARVINLGPIRLDQQHDVAVVREMLTLHGSDDKAIRSSAYQLFMSLGDGNVLAMLHWALDQPDVPIHAGVIEHVIRLQGKAYDLTPRLTARMLKDPMTYRWELANMLSAVGKAHPSVVDQLIDAAADEHPLWREMAQNGLDVLMLDPDFPNLLVTTLETKLRTGEPHVRIHAVRRLGWLRTEWPAAAALLAKTARDHFDESIRQLAAAVLAGEEDGKDEFGN